MNLACNVHIETLTQITKDQAERLINLTENNRGVILCLDPFVSGEVKIGYPLQNPDYIYLESETSVGGILWEIAKRYKEIYNGEERTTKQTTATPGLLNRGKSDGNYGIYGHDLGDLWFEGIEIKEGKITLSVGS